MTSHVAKACAMNAWMMSDYVSASPYSPQPPPTLSCCCCWLYCSIGVPAILVEEGGRKEEEEEVFKVPPSLDTGSEPPLLLLLPPSKPPSRNSVHGWSDDSRVSGHPIPSSSHTNLGFGRWAPKSENEACFFVGPQEVKIPPLAG